MIDIKNKYALAALSATSVIYALGASNIHAHSNEGKVTVDSLNIRSGPSTSDNIIGALKKGDKVEILSSKDGWYNIKYRSTAGWVSGDYISTNMESSDNSSSNSKILVATTGLNVREGDSTKYKKIGYIKEGQTVERLGVAKSGWYKVKLSNGIIGYSSNKYLKESNKILSSPQNSNNDNDTVRNLITTANLNVRSGPSTSDNIIGGLRKGDKVEALSSKDGWYNIKYGSKTGWISGDYVLKNSDSSDNSSSNGKILVATIGLNVREGSSTKYKKIGYIKKGHSVEILGIASTGWYKVKLSDGTIGYSSNKYLEESNNNPSRPPDNNDDDVRVIDTLIATANLNVRSGPSTSNSIIGIVYREDNVSIVERTNNNWYKIKLSSGKVGYCSATYLKSRSELDSVTNKPESPDDISYSMQVKSYAYYTGTITATGTKPIFGRTIAVDPKIIPYGSRVYIAEFDKTFIAEDCGGGIKGNKIDIYMNTEQECLNWGVRNITIYILK